MPHARLRFRLLGLLPLFFFGAHALYYWRRGEPDHILWLCNVGNLLLAAGLLLERPVLTRVAAVWLVPGLAVWYWYVVRVYGFVPSSTLAHLGGLGVGLYALSRVRVPRRTWLYALLWYLIVQQVCRFVTRPALNVNVAYSVYEGWAATFGAYWQFWLALTALVAAFLWLLVRLLAALWPPPTFE
ncbi:MAG TPA: hypothetical protein VF546_11250 [Pyrinomonadaceae bacterium]|jgi:hypothetical protein